LFAQLCALSSISIFVVLDTNGGFFEAHPPFTHDLGLQPQSVGDFVDQHGTVGLVCLHHQSWNKRFISA
jgi:hypothetical protein